ncbi:MAG: TraR/DksA C4-type zinc finger protein [Armatimonadota bacterium]
MAELDINAIKTKLLEEKAKLEQNIKKHNAEALLDESELADYDNHPADSATSTFDRTKSMALSTNEKQMLEQIDRALQKIEEGTYGKCDKCNADVNPERLEILPWATICINCTE